MEILGGIIAILAALVWFFKTKTDKVVVENKLAEIKGQDKQLEIEQIEVVTAIKAIDDDIAKAQAERELQRGIERNLTLKQRADRMRNGLK